MKIFYHYLIRKKTFIFLSVYFTNTFYSVIFLTINTFGTDASILKHNLSAPTACRRLLRLCQSLINTSKEIIFPGLLAEAGFPHYPHRLLIDV